MAIPVLNRNPVELHTAVMRAQRDYMMLLASMPGLTKSRTLTELMSYAAYVFLEDRPFMRDGWEWVRSPGNHRFVDGERVPNGAWVCLNPRLADILVKGEIVTGASLEAGLRRIAEAGVRKLRSNDSGMKCIVYSFILWMVTELYPPHIYAPVVSPPKRVADLLLEPVAT